VEPRGPGGNTARRSLVVLVLVVSDASLAALLWLVAYKLQDIWNRLTVLCG
jgi:hypothetical protein